MSLRPSIFTDEERRDNQLRVNFDFSKICKQTVDEYAGGDIFDGGHQILDDMEFSAAQWLTLKEHFRKEFAKEGKKGRRKP